MLKNIKNVTLSTCFRCDSTACCYGYYGPVGYNGWIYHASMPVCRHHRNGCTFKQFRNWKQCISMSSWSNFFSWRRSSHENSKSTNSYYLVSKLFFNLLFSFHLQGRWTVRLESGATGIFIKFILHWICDFAHSWWRWRSLNLNQAKNLK